MTTGQWLDPGDQVCAPMVTPSSPTHDAWDQVSVNFDKFALWQVHHAYERLIVYLPVSLFHFVRQIQARDNPGCHCPTAQNCSKHLTSKFSWDLRSYLLMLQRWKIRFLSSFLSLHPQLDHWPAFGRQKLRPALHILVNAYISWMQRWGFFSEKSWVRSASISYILKLTNSCE